jgi:type I restriction enzyme, S subunit
MKHNFTDLVDIVLGGTPKTSNSSYWNGQIGWLSVKDFGSANRFVYSSEKTITNDGLANSNTKMLNKGDIIISARGTVGALAQLGKPMAFNQSCYGLISKNKNVLMQDYLFYWLKANVKTLTNQASGSVFDTITFSSFKDIFLELPSLAEQRHIVGTTSSLQ